MTDPSPGTTPHDHDFSILRVELFRLHVRISLLEADLAAARLLAANRLAAIYATLNAEQDGDYDPLMYLRDQLDDESCAPAPGSGV